MTTEKLCTVEGCETVRMMNPGTGRPVSGFCHTHQNESSTLGDVIRNRAAERLGLTMKKSYKQGSLEGDWLGLSRERRKREMALQRQIDEGVILTSNAQKPPHGDPGAGANPEVMVEPEEKTGGPNKRRKVPPPTQKEFSSRVRWDESATMKALRHNARIDHEVCEFTQDPESACDALHLFPRWLARKMDVLHFVSDEGNIVFGLCLINRMMEKAGGHYIGVDGFLLVMDGKIHLPTLIKAGAYDTKIEMTPRRKFFANLAMMALGV